MLMGTAVRPRVIVTSLLLLASATAAGAQATAEGMAQDRLARVGRARGQGRDEQEQRGEEGPRERAARVPAPHGRTILRYSRVRGSVGSVSSRSGGPTSTTSPASM